MITVIEQRAERWAEDLIDLNPRTNSLLSFVPGRGAKIALTGGAPEAMNRFLLGERVRLSQLFTQPSELSKLIAQFRTLQTKANQLKEEQGIDALRVAFGSLGISVGQSRSTAATLRCPLLLASVAIESSSAVEKDYHLRLTGDDLEVNPILLYSLNRHFRVDLDIPMVERAMADALLGHASPPAQAAAVFAEINAQLGRSSIRPWLDDLVGLGLFSYEKFPMVRDLRESAALMAANPLIAALASYEPARRSLLSSSGRPSPATGDEVPPADEFFPLDADSSQQAAINATLAGYSAVIAGPPGTGKSQTIANIIASASAQGKKVLFVAEKRAAIEAVVARLAAVQLDGLIFDLHQSQLNKKQIAQQLLATLQRAGQESAPDVSALHRRLTGTRQALSAHAQVMNATVEPWGIKAFDVQARLMANRDEDARRVKLRGRNLDQAHGARLDGVRDSLRAYVYAEGLRVRRKDSPWAEAEVRDEEEMSSVLFEFDRIQSGVLFESQDELASILTSTHLDRPDSIAAWRELLDLLDQVRSTVDEFGEDVFGTDLDDLVAASAGWRSAERKLRPQRFGVRRRLRRQARRLSRSKLKRVALHEGLRRAQDQRTAWVNQSSGRGTPQQVEGLASVLDRFGSARNSLAAVALCLRLPDVEHEPTAMLDDRVRLLGDDRNLFMRLPSIKRHANDLEHAGLGPLLDHLAERESRSGRVSAKEAIEALEAVWLSSLEQDFRLRIPAFNQFMGGRHDEIVRDFIDSDHEHQRMNARRVRRQVAQRLRATQDQYPDQSQLVRKEATKKSRHLPMRELMAKAPDVLLAAHPCWAMSPLVVSKLLPAEQLFDLVIFDEASQVEPHDAITSIMRGRQLVIAGDSKQLPPSRIFQMLDAEPAADDDREDDLGDYESILDTLIPLLPNYTLRWHYRSRDERLIAFSNKNIYGGDLVTFAGCRLDSPLTLDVVPDSVAGPGGGGIAHVEVDHVVKLVQEHARLHPEESLGVIAFGISQADAIDGKLRAAKNDDPLVRDFMERHSGLGDKLFVKNIERVQGDERDAIILSVGRPKSVSGHVVMKFGNLNHEGGERRLNVAITRAKQRMVVVSSFDPSEMRPDATKNRGPELLRQFLEFAKAEGKASGSGHGRPTAELNGFERSVLDALTKAGIDAHPQWGTGGYTIDFALAHPDRPGEMVLAVEADGDAYHRAPSARDRDRLRQEHLERLGWRFHRVWASDWFRDQRKGAEDIVEAWRAAVAWADRPIEKPTMSPTEALSENLDQVGVDRGGCPVQIPRSTIDDYTNAELVRFFLWLLSDGLLQEREERLKEALPLLGFKKMGSRIREHLEGAFIAAQHRINERDSRASA